MARQLTISELNIVAGGQDDNKKEDEIIVVGFRNVSTFIATGNLTFAGNTAIDPFGEDGGIPEIEDEVIVEAQIQELRDNLTAIAFIVSLADALKEGFEFFHEEFGVLEVQPQDPRIVAFLAELTKLLDVAEVALAAGQGATLISNGQIEEGFSTVINSLLSTASGAILTAGLFGAIGSAATIQFGGSGGLPAGVVSLIVSSVFSIATEGVREQISDFLARALIDLINAGIDGVETVQRFVNDLEDAAEEIVGDVEEVIFDPPTVGGVPQGMFDDDPEDPSDPPPGFFDETPPPGTHYRITEPDGNSGNSLTG